MAVPQNSDQKKFQEVQAGDCGARKLEEEFRARLDSERKKASHADKAPLTGDWLLEV